MGADEQMDHKPMTNLLAQIDEKLKVCQRATRGPWVESLAKPAVYMNMNAQEILDIADCSNNGGAIDDESQQCNASFIAATRDGKLDYEQCLKALRVAVEELRLQCICIPDSAFPENRICDACKAITDIAKTLGVT